MMFSHPELLMDRLDNIRPFFQPIVEVASGKVTSYEALARFVKPDGDAVSAGYLFTDPRISVDDKRLLDRLVREKAIKMAKMLPDQTRMTLNISPQWLDLSSSELLPTLELLYKYDLNPQRIIVELTEFGGDIAFIHQAVTKYREAGIDIAIDDFGAGFSQLDRVIALEPDIIKLDMRLFQQGAQGGLAESVVESLATLCQKSGAIIICEGVETEEEFFFGLRCGARHMQGYLFSQATEEFIEPYTFSDQVKHLRMRFFDDEKAKTLKRRNSYQALVRQMEFIRNYHDSQKVLDVLMVSNALLKTDTVIRFYAANLNGDQTTANYGRSIEGHGFIEDDSFKGYNWSWRPYFYQLFSGEPMVLSEPYLDIETSVPCKTLSVQINGLIVLMVDVVI
ncbi:MAG: EAL domain-containing protein [Marinomonas sp.]